jgi:3-ketosteroid 9alpha-monooxygenase subunit B
MKLLRFWHALLAVLAVSAYLTEGVEPVHQLLGYGLVALILLRLLMALFGAGPLGLQRFYPRFHDLNLGTIATHPAISRMLLLGIAACLLGVTTTGLLMDRGEAFQTVRTEGAGRILAPGGAEEWRGAGKAAGQQRAHHDDDDEPDHDRGDRKAGGQGEQPLEEVHELFANLLIGIVALHVSYLLLFKWPLARFMLFLRPRSRRSPGQPTV